MKILNFYVQWIVIKNSKIDDFTSLQVEMLPKFDSFLDFFFQILPSSLQI